MEIIFILIEEAHNPSKGILLNDKIF